MNLLKKQKKNHKALPKYLLTTALMGVDTYRTSKLEQEFCFPEFSGLSLFELLVTTTSN